jgi:hypothetical protein
VSWREWTNYRTRQQRREPDPQAVAAARQRGGERLAEAANLKGMVERGQVVRRTHLKRLAEDQLEEARRVGASIAVFEDLAALGALGRQIQGPAAGSYMKAAGRGRGFVRKGAGGSSPPWSEWFRAAVASYSSLPYEPSAAARVIGAQLERAQKRPRPAVSPALQGELEAEEAVRRGLRPPPPRKRQGRRLG